MISRLALGVALGMTTRVAQEFYIRLRELDEFGRMPIKEAVDMIQHNKGTVAQHERLTALSLAQLHAAVDAAQLKQGMQAFDPRNPEDVAKIKALLDGGEGGLQKKDPGQYL